MREGPLRGGDRDRAKGSRNVKNQTGLPGGAQPESTAKPRADVDGADGWTSVPLHFIRHL